MKEITNCPNGHSTHKKTVTKTVKFRGVDVTFEVTHYVCPLCDMEIATVDQAAVVQKEMADAYRRETGLLTGEEIRGKREKLKLSRQSLAERTGVRQDDINNWEKWQIQSKSDDKKLRKIFGYYKEAENTIINGHEKIFHPIHFVFL